MTAQPTNPPEDQQPAAEHTDPIGPITLPKRARIGLRAMALVGTAGVLAVGVVEMTDTLCGWPTSISA